ncbi:MAG: hypothetical protein WDM90_11725 [Ferruginibacter sp.]
MFLIVAATAQAPYTIDIRQQSYTTDTGYLKMGSNKSPLGQTLSYNSRYLIKKWQTLVSYYGRVALFTLQGGRLGRCHIENESCRY